MAIAITAAVVLAGGNSPRAGEIGAERAASTGVASSIENGDSLSGAIRWTADVSGVDPVSIARVTFLIDGVERWAEQSPPYVFKGDDGLLDTRRLLFGPHTFSVRAVSVVGDVVMHSAVAHAADGVKLLHSNFEQPGKILPFDAFEYRGVFERGHPINAQLAWVTSPVRRGRHALRFTVRPGDRYGGSSGERALLRYTDQLSFDGADQYFAWSTLFPDDWAPPGWGLIFELHGDARFALAPIRFNAHKNSLTLDMTTGACTDRGLCGYHRRVPILSTLSKGRWNDFVVRLRLSKGRQGIVEVCHRVAGEREWRMAVQLRRIPTLPFFRGQGDPKIYFLWGLYTGPGATTRTLYGDNFTFSTRFSDIASAFARPPPKCRFMTNSQPRR